jgi:hypothetical protein
MMPIATATNTPIRVGFHHWAAAIGPVSSSSQGDAGRAFTYSHRAIEPPPTPGVAGRRGRGVAFIAAGHHPGTGLHDAGLADMTMLGRHLL